MTELQVQGKQGSLAQKIAETKEFAQLLIDAGLAPVCYNKNAGALAVAMIKGAEMGLTYTEAVSHLYVVQGRVSMDTPSLVYLFEKHGGRVQVIESSAEVCKIRLIQRGREPMDYTLTIEECKKAGWDKNSSGLKATWTGMPRIMLKNRCISNGIRAYSPASEFGGLALVDEIADVAPEESEVVESGIVDAEVTSTDWPIELAPAEPTPVVVASELPLTETIIKTATHWSMDKDARKNFWAWCTLNGLNTAEVHSIAGIGHLADYPGTEKQLRDLILAFIAKITAQQTAAESSGREDDNGMLL